MYIFEISSSQTSYFCTSINCTVLASSLSQSLWFSGLCTELLQIAPVCRQVVIYKTDGVIGITKWLFTKHMGSLAIWHWHSGNCCGLVVGRLAPAIARKKWWPSLGHLSRAHTCAVSVNECCPCNVLLYPNFVTERMFLPSYRLVRYFCLYTMNEWVLTWVCAVLLVNLLLLFCF